jgi:uncharacterized protein YukE
MAQKQEESIQEITLQVHAEYTLPPLFQSLTPQQTALTLTLGAQAYSIVKKEGQKVEHETLFQQLQGQAAAEYEPRLEQFQKEQSMLQTTLQTLKQQLQQEEEYRRSTEQRVREEERRNREELLQEKQNRIMSLEAQARQQLQQVELSMKETSRSLQDQFQLFKDSMLKPSAGSKAKGTQGETVFQELVQKAFGSVSCNEYFELEDVGKEGHQGDLRMNWKGHKVLLEVKNYERSVDDKEVKKFLRDMEEGRDVSLGILVSLRSGIVGHSKTGNVDLVELRDGRICIYLTHFLSHQDPVQFLQSLKPFMETFLQLRDKYKQEGTAVSAAEQQIERFELQRSILLKLLQNHQESTRKFKNTIQNAKKKQEQIWLEIGIDMRESEHQVKLLLETLLEVNSSSVEEQDVKSADYLPSYVFRIHDSSLCNEKERKFLKDLLTYFTVEEEASSPKKELKDVLKPLGYSEDAVNKYCERLLLEDVWEKGKQKVKHLQRKTT